MARARLARVLVLLACATACSADSGDEARAPVVRDSAGITIVENVAADPPGIPRWSIDTSPSLTIGTAAGDPAYEFSLIGSVLRLPSGMILVLDGQGESAFELRFYDSTGTHVATHGRRGQGPGEYRWINFVGAAGGDTVIAVDFPNRRINWVSARGGYLGSVVVDELRFKRLLGDDASGIVETMVPLGDSLFAIKSFRPIPNEPNRGRRANTFEIVDLRADSVIRLGRLEDPATQTVQLSQFRIMIVPVGQSSPMHVVDRDRRRICAATAHVAEISCVDDRGARRIIRWRSQTVPYTADDRRLVEERLRRSFGPPDYPESDAERMIAAQEWPERHAPFTVLQVDSEGNFWILEPTIDGSGARGSRFRVLDPDGRQIAFADSIPMRNVGLGARAHLGADRVLRAYEDADGAPVVGVFRIRK